jgi:hypothetical protein
MGIIKKHYNSFCEGPIKVPECKKKKEKKKIELGDAPLIIWIANRPPRTGLG